MMDVIVSVVLVSLSGALSPGPLTTMAILEGLWGGRKNGLKMALGHTIVELPYVIGLSIIVDILRSILEKPLIKTLMIGSSTIFIFYFAYLAIRDGIKGYEINVEKDSIVKSPLVAGIALTGLNPYFLLWWVTVGLPIITITLTYGIVGILIIYLAHVWLDYIWLTFIAGLGEYSSKLLTGWKYRALLVAIGVLLIIFGISLIMTLF
jgi:threonine/homoserine/homoserine lactone efflux protein